MESRVAAEQSEEYQQYNTSEQSQAIRKFMREKLGGGAEHSDILDCLMTTMCTDRMLPDAVNDYNNTKRSTNWFQTLSDFVRTCLNCSCVILFVVYRLFCFCFLPFHSSRIFVFQSIKGYNLILKHNDSGT